MIYDYEQDLEWEDLDEDLHSKHIDIVERIKRFTEPESMSAARMVTDLMTWLASTEGERAARVAAWERLNPPHPAA